MAKLKETRKSRVPKFKSYQEEAEFWNTHDTTDFEDEFEEVQVKAAKPLKITYTLRLDPDTVKELSQIAREKGIGPTTLARMWIVDRLKELQAGSR